MSEIRQTPAESVEPCRAFLRGGLADALRASGAIRTDEVDRAFRTVPRHLFAPGVPAAEAYADDVIITKRDEHDVAASSVSAPSMQAVMLERAGLRPGMRCLEIGSGGYNAALMAELAGPAGEVTTVDIDSEITGRASRCLATAGYGRVRVVLADAEAGVPDHAPRHRAAPRPPVRPPCCRRRS